MSNNRQIVTDCPVCKRVIWTGSICYHGKIPYHVDDIVYRPVKSKEPAECKRPKKRDSEY